MKTTANKTKTDKKKVKYKLILDKLLTKPKAVDNLRDLSGFKKSKSLIE